MISHYALGVYIGAILGLGFGVGTGWMNELVEFVLYPGGGAAIAFLIMAFIIEYKNPSGG